MRIGLATNFFPPCQPGGTEAYTYTLARILQRWKQDVRVICADRWGQGSNWEPVIADTVQDGVSVRRLAWNWEAAPNPFVDMYDNAPVERLFSVWLAQVQPDLVHITSFYSLGARIIRACQKAGVPTVVTPTDFWFLCPKHTLHRGDGTLCPGPESALGCQQCMGTSAKLFRALCAFVEPDAAAKGLLATSRYPKLARLRGLRGYVGDAQARLEYLRGVFDDIDLIIAPSRFLIDTFARNGFPAHRIHLQRHGIDTSWLPSLQPRPVGEHPRLAYVGQLDPIKGVDLLVKAFKSQLPGSSAELRIHGDAKKNPGFASRLRALAEGSPAVSFMGPFERSQVAEVYSAVDAVVVPSIWYENAPVVIAEALAAGKPVIASDLGSIRELVEHEVNGLLFERGNEQALEEAIRRFTRDAALRERLSRGARLLLSIDQEVSEILRLYRTLVR